MPLSTHRGGPTRRARLHKVRKAFGRQGGPLDGHGCARCVRPSVSRAAHKFGIAAQLNCYRGFTLRIGSVFRIVLLISSLIVTFSLRRGPQPTLRAAQPRLQSATKVSNAVATQERATRGVKLLHDEAADRETSDKLEALAASFRGTVSHSSLQLGSVTIG